MFVHPLALVVLLSCTILPGEDPHWSRFRGPNGSGLAPDAAPLPAALDPETNLLWSCDVSEGQSSPCIREDCIFLTGLAGDELETLCIDRATGKVRWRRAVTPDKLERHHKTHNPATPTPTTDGERVFVYFGSFGLIAYDLAGEEAWRRELPSPENSFGTAASPVLADGKLVFVHDANEGSFLEALDPATGETLWRADRSSFKSGWSTPAVWRRGDVTELLVLGVWWLTAYDLETGEERWSVPGLTDEPIVTPTTGDGLVFLSSYNMKTNTEVIGIPEFAALLEEHDHDGDGRLDAKEAEENQSVLSRHDADGEGDHPLRIFFRFLDEDRDGYLVEAEWGKLRRWLGDFEHANAVVAIRPGSGETEAKIAWQHVQGVPECPSPLYYRGRVWFVKNGGMATCVDAKTGELKFRGRIGARGPCYASPVAGDGKIYAASARGVVTVLAAEDELRVLSNNDLGERIMATPALLNGKVYVRTESHLHAFGDGD